VPKPCPFCGIAEGTLPASIVARTEALVAFLDARPVFKGHVLIAPRAHVEDFEAMPDELAGPLLVLGKRVARALERGLGAQGAFVALNHRVSQSVAHLHLHVVPRTKGDGLRGFFWPRTSYASDEERDQFAARIASALEQP
jgi:histidine triad (HIT) family protein